MCVCVCVCVHALIIIDFCNYYVACVSCVPIPVCVCVCVCVCAVIIMDFCDYGSLVRPIVKGMFRPFSASGNDREARVRYRALLRTAKEIAQGLEHLHYLNVVHGDLKPGNVLLKGSRVDVRGFNAQVSEAHTHTHTHTRGRVTMCHVFIHVWCCTWLSAGPLGYKGVVFTRVCGVLCAQVIDFGLSHMVQNSNPQKVGPIAHVACPESCVLSQAAVIVCCVIVHSTQSSPSLCLLCPSRIFIARRNDAWRAKRFRAPPYALYFVVHVLCLCMCFVKCMCLRMSFVKRVLCLQVSKAGGTLVYAAPEVFSGRVGKAADVYSLGIILWEMVTGSQPYKDLAEGET